MSDPVFLGEENLAPGMPVLHVTTPAATASIALQGAHLFAWQPRGQAPVIWLSERSPRSAGRPLRGGIPLCWPWFGPHGSDSTFPAHGCVRTLPWRLAEAHLEGDRACLEFEPAFDDASRSVWPHPTALRYRVTIGEELHIELVTTNSGVDAFTLTQALHTYFAVGDIRQVRIDGLDGHDYLDKPDGYRRQRQHGSIGFSGETDRIYLDTANACTIHDPAMGRRIVVTGSGSRSTVVWNPWVDKSAHIGEFSPDGYTRMVCVETANAADDTITLLPGASHRLAARYQVLPL